MFRYLVVLLAVVASMLLMSGTHAQQPPQDQQQVALTREIVEDLLRVLSANCRSELEGAIESQTMDLSMDCKYEIQKNLLDMGHIGAGGQGAAGSDGFQDMYEDGEPAAKAAAAKPATNNFINPVLGIILFVVVLFAGAAYAVTQISGKVGIREPKKLSKKKVTPAFIICILGDWITNINTFSFYLQEEKLRMKSQR
jgi:uncharacterized membrane protein YgcG